MEPTKAMPSITPESLVERCKALMNEGVEIIWGKVSPYASTGDIITFNIDNNVSGRGFAISQPFVPSKPTSVYLYTNVSLEQNEMYISECENKLKEYKEYEGLLKDNEETLALKEALSK